VNTPERLSKFPRPDTDVRADVDRNIPFRHVPQALHDETLLRFDAVTPGLCKAWIARRDLHAL
jgi:hypothetical protein